MCNVKCNLFRRTKENLLKKNCDKFDNFKLKLKIDFI